MRGNRNDEGAVEVFIVSEELGYKRQKSSTCDSAVFCFYSSGLQEESSFIFSLLFVSR